MNTLSKLKEYSNIKKKTHEAIQKKTYKTIIKKQARSPTGEIYKTTYQKNVQEHVKKCITSEECQRATDDYSTKDTHDHV
ncbi:30277_t:CDS:2 [Gigaspora margarita]|uniref:30277_t:CDS:1 n=1 Tax=Gigaspora margarita TaxID=4874 RepID=A0ABN7WMI1_GIGMA|nr:30277_t:CDS:2 [Gigaspora margarita]